MSLVEAKQEKIPKKLAINVDPSLTGIENKTLTAVGTHNAPEASHTKLKQEQDKILKEIAEIQKQED